MEREAPRIKLGEIAGAAALLALVLAVAYGPAKLQHHLIYGGVIQDLTNLYGFHNWDIFSAQEFSAGRFPLWNPHNAFGVPHLANMQSAVFYPLNWLKFALGFFNVIDYILLLRLFLAGIFTWAFLRRALGVSFLPAMIGGSAFMLCGYFTRYVYMSHLNVETLIPLQLLLLHLLAEKATLRRLILAGIGFALLIIGGFPEATIWAFVIALAYYLFGAGLNPRTIVTAAAALLIGLLISLVQWLPFAEYYPHLWTYHLPGDGMKHFDPRLIVSLISPWFFGMNAVSPAVPFLSPYLGAVPVILAVHAVLRPKPPAIFFAAAALFFLGVIYGLFPASLIGRVFPFDLTYNYKYAAPALAFAVACLAGIGAERLKLEQSFIGFGAAAIAVTLFLAINLFIARSPAAFAPLQALGLFTPGIFAAAFGLCLLSLAAAWLKSSGKITARTALASILAFSVLGLLFDMIGQMPSLNDDLATRADPLKKLASSSGKYRAHVDPELKDFFSDNLLPLGIDDLSSYEPLYPWSYVAFMAKVNEISGSTVLDNYNRNMLFTPDRDKIKSPLLELAGVFIHILPAPIDERLLGREWADHADSLAGGPGTRPSYAEVKIGDETETGLIAHAPALTEAMVALQAGEWSALRFDAGIPRGQWAGAAEPDGVSMAALERRGGKQALIFARYLDPARAPRERGWLPFSILLPPGKDAARKLSLLLLRGPRNGLNRDALIFGSLRIRSGKVPEGMEKVEEGADFVAYKNNYAFPRAWWVAGVAPPLEGAEYFDTVVEVSRKNPRAFESLAVVPAGEFHAATLPEIETGEHYLKPVSREPGRVTLQSSRGRSGFVVITDQYFPGFRAFIKGGSAPAKEVRILPANGPFMAMAVPTGEWSIEVIYQPWGFRIGLWVSLSLLFALVLTPLWRRMAGTA